MAAVWVWWLCIHGRYHAVGIVMYIYHEEAEDWSEALKPVSMMSCLTGGRCREAKRKRAMTKLQKQHRQTPRNTAKANTLSDEAKLKNQEYAQIFFVLDADFGGSLDIHEISLFGKYALGEQWNIQMALDFIAKYDADASNTLSMEEFIVFWSALTKSS